MTSASLLINKTVCNLYPNHQEHYVIPTSDVINFDGECMFSMVIYKSS